MTHKRTDILPLFNDNDVLPYGDYELTIQQLRDSFLVTQKEDLFIDDTFIIDSEWRGELVNNLEILVNQLWQVGITNIFIDGSFVEAKSRPGDIDGYFEIDKDSFLSGDFENEINQLDRYKVWNWTTKRKDRNTKKFKIDMWHIYKVELWPHFGQSCGIYDELGNELDFPAAFRKSRQGFTPKGIIKLIKN